jgi:tetratricopeptide (TPR) repeat protein
MHLLAHELDAAIETAEETLALVEEHDLASWYQTHYALGRAQCLSGDLDAARDTIERLEERAPWFDPDGSSLVAQERYFRGAFAEAVEAAWTSVNSRAVDHHGFVWPVVLARIAIAVDELEAAEANLELVLEYEDTPQYRYWSQLALVDRARIHRQRGELAAAAEDLDDARERAEECGFQLAAARATLQQGALAVDRDAYETAAEQLEAAVDTLDDLDTPFYAARARFERGRCARGAGDLEAAREWLTDAAEQCQAIEARYEAARVLDVLADVCEQLDDETAAATYREQRPAVAEGFDDSELRLPDSWPEEP